MRFGFWFSCSHFYCAHSNIWKSLKPVANPGMYSLFSPCYYLNKPNPLDVFTSQKHLELLSCTLELDLIENISVGAVSTHEAKTLQYVCAWMVQNRNLKLVKAPTVHEGLHFEYGCDWSLYLIPYAYRKMGWMKTLQGSVSSKESNYSNDFGHTYRRGHSIRRNTRRISQSRLVHLPSLWCF